MLDFSVNGCVYASPQSR